MSLTTKTNISLLLVILALTLFIPKSRAAEEPEIETLMQQFEAESSYESANLFMDALYHEQFIDKPVHFTAKMPIDTMRQQVYYWAGEWLYDQQRYDEARKITLKALPLFHPLNDARADCLNLLGIIYIRLGDFSNAANYARQCLEMDMRSGDDDRISSSMNTIAGIYMTANQPKEAEKYILGAIDHSSRVDNQPRRAVILGMASEIYHKLGEDEQALDYAKQAYSIDSSLGRERQAAIRLSQQGYALLGLQRYQEAEEVFNQVLPTLKDIGDRHSYAIVLNNMGRAVYGQGRPADAIKYYKEASEIFSQMGDLYNEIHSHCGLYESYWEINPDSAKIELNSFNLLKDSLYSHSTADALSRYNAEFGNDMLQMENSMMRQAHQRTIIVGVLLILLIIVAAWLIIMHMRRRIQRRMQKLMADIERLRSCTDDNIPSEPVAELVADVPADTIVDETHDEDKEFLKRVIDIVNDGMADGNIGVVQIASQLNMSEQSFRRKVQSIAGETPKAFLTAIRMERASSLLLGSPEIPVTRIAELCGFENASSFGHTFKRMYGCSPSQYRDKTLAD